MQVQTFLGSTWYLARVYVEEIRRLPIVTRVYWSVVMLLLLGVFQVFTTAPVFSASFNTGFVMILIAIVFVFAGADVAIKAREVIPYESARYRSRLRSYYYGTLTIFVLWTMLIIALAVIV